MLDGGCAAAATRLKQAQSVLREIGYGHEGAGGELAGEVLNFEVMRKEVRACRT